MDSPAFSETCDVFKGCLNGDVFKFGPLIAGILIIIEIMFWCFLGYYITKKLIKRQTSAPVDKDGNRLNDSNSYPPRYRE